MVQNSDWVPARPYAQAWEPSRSAALPVAALPVAALPVAALPVAALPVAAVRPLSD